MVYPERLLPKSSYKIITNPDSEEFLVRRVNPGIEVWDEDFKLSPTAVVENNAKNNLLEYSVNKLPPSNYDDVKIKINKNECLEDWKEGENGVRPNENEFEIIEEINYFLIQIKDVDNYGISIESKSNPSILNFKLSIKHKPLKANYAHFEFQVVDKDGNVVEKKGKAFWRKVLVSRLRSKIIRVAKNNLDEFNDLFK